MAVIGPLSWPLACLERRHLATGLAIKANKLMDNAFEEAPSPGHHRQSTIAPKRRSREACRRGASMLVCIYIERE